MIRRGLLELGKLQEKALFPVSPAAWRNLSRGFAQAQPESDGVEEEEARVVDNPQVTALAEEILKLNMLEIHDLTSILKKRLGISDVAAMGMGMGMMGGMAQPQVAAPAAGDGESQEKAKEVEKTEFNVKLESFEATSKIKLIKEIRGVTELGLKEAKDLVSRGLGLDDVGIGIWEI